MSELKCPNCGKVFTVDESDYALILNQVRGAELDAEVTRRIGELHAKHQAEVKVLLARKEQEQRDALNRQEVNQQKMQGDFDRTLSAKEVELQQLKAQLATRDERHAAALQLAMKDKDAEIATLQARLSDNDRTLQIALMEEREKAQQTLHARDTEINDLRTSRELDRQKAELSTNALKEHYESQLKMKQEEVDYYKDLKSRLSTKMIGETLEQHCSTLFNQMLRPYLPHAYFEKDNDASEGTKGDFIFRDYGEDGTEYLSIMFEMKNEADQTATKHKNEDFFKKLDKDRMTKHCEFAVLVSLLEPDNEYYNAGITDVSYRYEKMYVVRPQFFLPLISLLVQTSRKSLDYKRRLIEAESQNIDVTNFEKKMAAFRKDFAYHYDHAATKFNDAIKNLDETIKQLTRMRENLLGSITYLRRASEDTETLDIKRLTRGNPTMKQKFEEARAAESATASDPEPIAEHTETEEE